MSCKNQTPETHGPCGICSECVKFPDPSPDRSLRSGLEEVVEALREICRYAVGMQDDPLWIVPREQLNAAWAALQKYDALRSRAGEQETS